MKKIFLITMAAIMITAFAVPAMASGSRLASLGDVDNYIEDSGNIYKWPATLPSFANCIKIDIWPGGMGSYGFIYGLGEYGDKGTIGLFFMENTSGPNDVFDVDPGWLDWDRFSTGLANKYSVIYAYEMDKMALGLNFSRASSYDLHDDPVATLDDENSSAYTTIGASVRMDINDDMYADIGFDYTMISYTDEIFGPVVGDLTEDTGTKMDFNARLFYDYSEAITLIPYLGFGMADYNITGEDAAAYFGGFNASGAKATNFKLGIAANFEVNEDNMVILGIEPFSMAKAEPSAYAQGVTGSWEGKMVTMPRFLLALETDVKDWLTIRTGCTKALNKTTTTVNNGTDETVDEETMAPFDWHLGLAFHISDFDIDCVLEKDAPYTMGYWLTGYTTGSQVISRISAVYHF